MSKWRVKVGLEIHARINAKSKLFSGSSSKFTHNVSNANEQVSMFDASIPGTLPRLNEACVDQAILTGLALNGVVNRRSVFERKHYFYGDSPLGYQITQQSDPIVSGGLLSFRYTEGERTSTTKMSKCRITRIQLEQDTGRLSVEEGPYSLLDLNRAGTGVMEIVTEPDLRSSDETAGFVGAVQALLRHIGSCDGKLEDGSMRADVNVSIHSDTFDSHRVEIKNLNSIRGVAKAVDYEVSRLEKMYSNSSERQSAETRSFNSQTNTTVSSRSKDAATDYRFFPEPDLLPLYLSKERIDRLARSMPMLPEDIVTSMIERFGLSEYDARVLFHSDANAYFEQVLDSHRSNRDFAKSAANWICNSILELIKDTDKHISSCGIPALVLGELIQMVQNETISHASGKIILSEYVKGGFENIHPLDIANDKDLLQMNDEEALRQLCLGTLTSLSATKKGKKNLEMFKGGKESLLGFFVGQGLRDSHGRANPRILNAIMLETLKKT